jgi:hypothetical protein
LLKNIKIKGLILLVSQNLCMVGYKATTNKDIVL